MRKRALRLLAVSILAAAACAAYSAAQPYDGGASASQDGAQAGSGRIEARLTAAQGPVYVHLADDPEGEYRQAQTDAPLDEGDVVRTGEGASAEVALDGGSVVSIDQNTDFIVRSLDKSDARFTLGIGSIIAKLKKLLPGQNLSFRTPTAVAAVRGTELGLSQDGDDSPAHVGVFDEGHVLVQSRGQSGYVALDPGQETEVAKGAAPTRPQPLRYLAARRALLGRLRARQRFLLRTWRPRSRAERMRLRRRWLALPRLRGAQLRGVRADRAARVYGRLRAIRRERRERLQRQPRRQEQPEEQRQQGRPQQRLRERLERRRQRRGGRRRWRR